MEQAPRGAEDRSEAQDRPRILSTEDSKQPTNNTRSTYNMRLTILGAIVFAMAYAVMHALAYYAGI